MNASDLPGEPVKAFCFSELRRTGWGLHTQAALRKPERMKVLELQPLSLSTTIAAANCPILITKATSPPQTQSLCERGGDG